MDVVSLSLVGLTSDMKRSELQASLAKLYGKPETYFSAHCEKLCELNTPCVLLEKVSRAEAHKHCERLEALGIKTEISDYVDPSGLSLVPLTGVVEQETECPACDQVTTHTEICSQCGVVIAKFVQSQKNDEHIKRKLISADKTAGSVEEFRATEQRRRRDAALKKREREKNAEPVHSAPPEDDHFTAAVEDSTANKVTLYVAAAVVMAVFGSGYLAYQLKNKIDNEATYDYSGTTEASGEPTSVASNNTDVVGTGTQARPTAPPNAPSTELSEAPIFSEWTAKIDDAERLKNNLTVLNNSEGMSSTMEGLVVQNTDPFVRIIGTQKLVELRVQDAPAPLLNAKNDMDEKYSEVLERSESQINALSSKYEQLFARLSLARVYSELQQHEESGKLLEQAKRTMIGLSNQGDSTDLLMAEVISAEYFADFEADEKMRAHYERAVQLAEQLDPESKVGKWSIPFIVRSQARSEQYASAYELLEKIDDSQVSEIVMNDISAYAQIDERNIEELTLESDVGELFANDPDMQLLIENQKTMKQNAERISKFSKLVEAGE